MDILTLDFETYYSTEYTLSRLTTEEYIRDPRFETILCGFAINDERPYWVDGPDVGRHLATLPISRMAVAGHHMHFDGLILSHHYNVRPKLILDTLSMARGLIGGKAGLSLAKLAERFNLGRKGTEVLNAKGMRRADFTPLQLGQYALYCCNDVELTRKLVKRLLTLLPRNELRVVDMVIRMFTEPEFVLDTVLLQEYLQEVQAGKLTALMRAGIQLCDVMSNDKFAAALEFAGVIPPTKISPTTGKETWAFAKTDPQMEALAEHPDEAVQALVAARLKNKTTIAETRTQRMIGVAARGPAPVYLHYSGADQTHRLCLDGDTRITVLRQGVVLDILLSSLEDIDLVWDGEEFVTHGGLVDHGEREVITYCGLTGTADHRIYVEEISGEVELQEAMLRGYTPKAAARPEQHDIDAARLGRNL